MSEYHMPRTDAPCAHPNCPNYADEGDLCEPHAWQAEHPGETYDVFRDCPASPHFDTERNPGVEPRRNRSVHMRFPTSDGTRTTPRSSAGMGSGQHKPSEDSPVLKGAKWPSGYPSVYDEPDDVLGDGEDVPDMEPRAYDERDEDAEHLWFVAYKDSDTFTRHSRMVTHQELRDLGNNPNINLKTILRDDDDDCPKDAEPESQPLRTRHFMTTDDGLIDADTGEKWRDESDDPEEDDESEDEGDDEEEQPEGW